MCGLAGLVDLDGLSAPLAGLDRALARLRPRGPDGRGVWGDGRALLGHTRLAVIDLSPAGHQPMTGHGGVLAFNGEIYNHAALREELTAAGHVFASRTDSEVLLAGWDHWGPDLLPRLQGMFAFALWRPAEGALILARDRFGKKPLLLHPRGRRLGFASDLKALAAVDAGTGALDPAALRLFFALGWLPEPVSIAQGVTRLPAGHWARLDGDGLAVRRWYDLATARGARIADPRVAAERLTAAFDAAVADRLVADVPVGAYLSGGIDSALVVATMARHAARVRTFTIGFAGAADYYQEGPEARLVADHVGSDHTELTVGPDQVAAALDGVFDALDEPFADSSAVPSWLIAREIRGHVTVALSGDGADEAFGGYRKYLGELFAENWRRLPGRSLVAPMVRALPESKAHPVLERVRRLRRFVAHADKEPAARQAGWLRLNDESELDALLGPAPAEAVTVEDLILAARVEARDDDPLNTVLAADLALGLPSDMLAKVDRTSMAHGLEVRCPFLDHRVVEVAAALPGALKVRAGQGKRILRTAFADRLPAEVFRRPKKGFEVPIAQWLTGPLADLTRRAIDPATLERQGLIRPDLPARWYADLAGGRRDTAGKLWALVAFQAWWERT